MKTIYPQTDIQALTVRKEHRLTLVTQKAIVTTSRIVSKALLGAVVLTLLNFVI